MMNNSLFDWMNKSNGDEKANSANLIQYEIPDSLEMSDSIEVFDFPIRTANALKKRGIKTVGDLLDYPENKLIKIKCIGIKTCNAVSIIKKKIQDEYLLKNSKSYFSTCIDGIDMSPKIYNALEKTDIKTVGQSTLIKKTSSCKPITNEELIDVLLNRSGDKRSKEIILRRYGLLTGEKQTLEEIGEDFKVSRERIRQIQVKTLKIYD